MVEYIIDLIKSTCHPSWTKVLLGKKAMVHLRDSYESVGNYIMNLSNNEIYPSKKIYYVH